VPQALFENPTDILREQPSPPENQITENAMRNKHNLQNCFGLTTMNKAIYKRRISVAQQHDRNSPHSRKISMTDPFPEID
jgi:hypothetical protein